MLTFSNKTVMITGATGLIGSHIIDALMAMGDVKVIAVGRSEEKLKIGFAEYAGDPNFQYIAQDVSKGIRLPEDTAVDVIFHAASLVGGRVVAERPMDAISPNLAGTESCIGTLLRQREETGTDGRLVLFSSVTIYGGAADEDITVTEDDTAVTEKLDTLSAPYSQSKRMAEVIALAAHRQFGLDVVIVRPSTVYGFTRFRPNTVFNEFLDCAVGGRDITMNKSGIGRRDNIYVGDAVPALLRVCQMGESGQAYNISSNGEMGGFAAVDEIAEEIVTAVNKEYERGTPVRVIYKQGKTARRAGGIKLDNAKMKSLGCTLNTSLREGIQETVRLHRQMGYRG